MNDEKPKCTEKYGNPKHACTRDAKWWFLNPATREREGPYCGIHARQFLPKALRPVDKEREVIE